MSSDTNWPEWNTPAGNGLPQWQEWNVPVENGYPEGGFSGHGFVEMPEYHTASTGEYSADSSILAAQRWCFGICTFLCLNILPTMHSHCPLPYNDPYISFFSVT